MSYALHRVREKYEVPICTLSFVILWLLKREFCRGPLVLRLHPGKSAARRALRRHHQRSLQTDYGAQGKIGARVHEDLWNRPSGLLRRVRVHRRCTCPRAGGKALAPRMEIALVEKANPDWRDLADEIVP
jgi:hypothetical protein